MSLLNLYHENVYLPGVCRTIPKSLKMFYGHVFCAECFKTHVLSRFRGESPRIHSNSWWMHWGPGGQPQGENKNYKSKGNLITEKLPLYKLLFAPLVSKMHKSQCNSTRFIHGTFLIICALVLYHLGEDATSFLPLSLLLPCPRLILTCLFISAYW